MFVRRVKTKYSKNRKADDKILWDVFIIIKMPSTEHWSKNISYSHHIWLAAGYIHVRTTIWREVLVSAIKIESISVISWNRTETKCTCNNILFINQKNITVPKTVFHSPCTTFLSQKNPLRRKKKNEKNQSSSFQYSFRVLRIIQDNNLCDNDKKYEKKTVSRDINDDIKWCQW